MENNTRGECALPDIGHHSTVQIEGVFGIPSCAFLSMTPALFVVFVFEALRRSKLHNNPRPAIAIPASNATTTIFKCVVRSAL